jgi:hypothetical protein
MKEPKAIKDLNDDELAARILNALGAKELTHDQVIAIGDSPHHTASVLESLLATGLIESYCGSVRPSTCMYKLAGKH